MKKQLIKAVIVLPTYNEIGNIGKLLDAIRMQQQWIDYADLSVLVVDDSSPDGTGEFVKDYALKHPEVKLLNGAPKQGLGVAYVRGFKYAISKLGADVVFQMDADFSHNPNDIPRLLHESVNGSDFVIGSRYVKGGSIPENWPLLRKLNSRCGNIFARYMVGLGNVRDCTGGFRAISAETLKKINFNKLHAKGYAFIVSLLHHALQNGASVKEIPIHFTDRTSGTSKLKIKDIREFIFNALLIRFPFLVHTPFFLLMLSIGIVIGELSIIGYMLLTNGYITTQAAITSIITVFTLSMTAQGVLSIYWMLYAWEDAERIERDKPPSEFISPRLSFTAIIPARHEEKVIADTIKSIAGINYPDELKEALIVCRSDDYGTITKVKEVISSQNNDNIRLILFDDTPINKPHSLNIGLKHATKDIVVIFDAEDQPHKDIYNIANTVMQKQKIGVLQAGVQLMNIHSRWFSTLNVLEYFFWFKSTLHFFAKVGIIPLGGNTVFFKKQHLIDIGGWDEDCLTEDADIGIRLSAAGIKVQVVYSGEHVTQEETPDDIKNFIQQRTRWNQGFIQVLLKGDWLQLPRLSQKLLALYILTLPEFQAVTFILIPLSIVMVALLKLPVILALLTSIPLLLLIVQLIIYNLGLYEFTKEYKHKFSLVLPLRIMLTFYPFQLLLGLSALRAFIRALSGNRKWEKTQHTNAHRSRIQLKPAYTMAN